MKQRAFKRPLWMALLMSCLLGGLIGSLLIGVGDFAEPASGTGEKAPEPQRLSGGEGGGAYSGLNLKQRVSDVSLPVPAKSGDQLAEATGDKTRDKKDGAKSLVERGKVEGGDKPPGSVRKASGKPDEPPLRLPVLEGAETLGLELPETENGKLSSYFSIEKITRVSASKVRLDGGFLQFFEEDGSLEFSIDLANAVIEEDTRMLIARVPVTVRTPSLEVTGMGLEFNTKTRAGGLKGPVRMLIYPEDHE